MRLDIFVNYIIKNMWILVICVIKIYVKNANFIAFTLLRNNII